MYFDGVVRIMGKIDVSEMKSLVEEIPESAWESDWRKNVNPNFYDSHSVWMKSMPFTKDKIFHAFDSSCTCQHDGFQQAYLDFQRQLENMLDGIVVRSCIIRLTSNNSVKRHIDGQHDIFRYCYRIIIPILTNSKSILKYDDHEFVLEEGIVYDTNPYLPHSTFNGGETNRYQAVIDVFPNTVPENEITLRLYDVWDPKLCKSLEPKGPVDRNNELHIWEERYEKEKVRALQQKEIFKHSDLSDDGA